MSVPVLPLRWISFWNCNWSLVESFQILKKQTEILILRTSDNCVDKVGYSIIFTHSSCYNDKIKSWQYDMWSLDNSLTDLTFDVICRLKLYSLRLRLNNANKLSKNIFLYTINICVQTILAAVPTCWKKLNSVLTGYLRNLGRGLHIETNAKRIGKSFFPAKYIITQLYDVMINISTRVSLQWFLKTKL